MKDKYAETGLTMKELAAHFGCTEASISRVINEKHNGKELTRKVEEYLDSIIYKDIRGTEYDLTPGQKRGMVLLQLLRSDNKFGLLLGHSGIGKTYMCRRFQEKEPDTRVFTPDEGMSMGGLLTGLCRLWGIGGTGTIDQKRSRLKESAKGRFLIVDEADNLTKGRPVRQILRMIEIFRKMYDNGAGIALVGLPSFLDDIRSAGETYIYIYSRIQFKSDITPPNRDQMTAVWKNRINGVPVNSAETEKIILSAPKSGYFRYVQSVADTAKKFGDVEAALAVSFIA